MIFLKTVESRDVWNSPENATDFPSLSFEIHHVDKTRQSFFCAITASNETKATAEIMAVFKKVTVCVTYSLLLLLLLSEHFNLENYDSTKRR